jgi:hypothetical protein
VDVGYEMFRKEEETNQMWSEKEVLGVLDAVRPGVEGIQNTGALSCCKQAGGNVGLIRMS